MPGSGAMHSRSFTCAAPKHGFHRGGRLIVVDVGGGRGDLAVHVVRWARRRGRPVRVLVLDADAGTLALARHHTMDYPEIVLVRADAGALPLREGAAEPLGHGAPIPCEDRDGGRRGLSPIDRAPL